MKVSAIIAKNMSGWTFVPEPADPKSIEALVAAAQFQLPEEYLDLLRLHDGGEGELGADPGFFMIWSVSEVIVSNREYEVPENLPGFFAFGSNGGGEMLAFDCRKKFPWPVVMIPFIPMDVEDLVPITSDFKGFLRLMGKTCP